MRNILVSNNPGISEAKKKNSLKRTINTNYKINIPLWICMALIIRSTVFHRGRVGSQFAEIDLYAMMDILIVFISITYLLFSPRTKMILSKLRGTAAFIFVIYYIISTLSALWSPIPQFTFYRAIEFLSQFLLILIALSYSKNYRQMENEVLIFSTLSIIFSLLMIYKYVGFSSNLLHWHTNVYTASAAMLFCYLLPTIVKVARKRKLKNILIFAFSTFALIFGTSTASYISAIFGVVILTILSKNKLYLLLVVFFVISIYTSQEFASTAERVVFFGKEDYRVGNLSGRERLWNELSEMVKQKPVLGYGFAIAAKIDQHVASNTHNSIFSVLLGTGFVGLIIFFVFLFRLIRESLKYIRMKNINIGLVAALGVGIVNSLSIPLIADQWAMSPSFVFSCLLAYFTFIMIKNREKKSMRLKTSGLIN